MVHINRYLPDDSDRAPANRWSSFNVEKLMQAPPMFLLSDLGQWEVKDAVEENDNQDEDVAVVARLVDGHNETESLHDKWEEQNAGDQERQLALSHL